MFCATCSTGGKTGCLTCIDGYEIQTDGSCKKIVVTVPAIQCVGEAYYNKRSKSCVCYDIQNKIYYEKLGGCLTKEEWAQKTTCTKGEYFDETKSSCIGCRTNNDENLCASCNGPEPENCI